MRFLLICNVITSKLAVKTLITREKCCGNKSCSVSGGGSLIWSRSVPATEGGSRAQNLPGPPALKTSGQRGSTESLWIQLPPGTVNLFFFPNTFFIIIIQADGGFQFSVFTSRSSHLLHSECFWAPDNRKYFENPFFFSHYKQRRFKSHPHNLCGCVRRALVDRALNCPSLIFF